MQKQEIDVILIDDNEIFCHLLLHDLSKSIQNINVQSKFAIKIHSFINSEDCIVFIKKNQFKNTIAFIDYYLGEAINGSHIFKLLKKCNMNLSVVMISKSQNIKGKMQSLSDQNIHFHFVVKDQYTPAICVMFLEHYLKDLQSQI